MLTCALLRHCSKGASEAENAAPDVQLLSSLLQQEPASCQQRSWEVSKTLCHAQITGYTVKSSPKNNTPKPGATKKL